MTGAVSLRHTLGGLVPVGVRARLSPLPDWSIAVVTAPTPTDLVQSCDDRSLVWSPAQRRSLGLRFVADPFAVRQAETWHLFFEAVPVGDRRGRIGVATSRDLSSWSYEGLVLSEDFHLSFPYVFCHDGHHFLIPESWESRTVRLYRAVAFPHRWELDTILLRGAPFKDSTVLRHDDGRWYLFTETSPRHRHDQLRLFSADDLRGPWVEHPQSPVVDGDADRGRPAGRPVAVDGRLIRFSQACSDGYGRSVLASEVLELSATTYRERPLAEPVLTATGTGWNASAMHHVDAHEVDGRWVCFVDGHP